MNLAGRNLQAAPLDWAELMSQKIPQPGLQGSPWASGETGSSRTGGRMRCVSWGAFCRLLNERGRLLRIRLGIGGWNSHKDSKEERASEVCVTGWSRDYPALICKLGCTRESWGPRLLARCTLFIKPLPTPHQAAPKVWNVPPILFIHAPSHSRPTAGEGLAKEQTYSTVRAVLILTVSGVCRSTIIIS